MKLPLDECILSCAEVAEQAYLMMIELEPREGEEGKKTDKICGLLAVLAMTLDDLTERVNDEIGRAEAEA